MIKLREFQSDEMDHRVEVSNGDTLFLFKLIIFDWINLASPKPKFPFQFHSLFFRSVILFSMASKVRNVGSMSSSLSKFFVCRFENVAVRDLAEAQGLRDERCDAPQ